jgi:hypothetical protein
MLKSLADEIQLALRRDAQASSANLLLAAARCEALRVALAQKPTAALVGQHRTQYQEVGQLTLIGLGAQHWQSKGGYRGITLYFWDESRRAFATWSDARPSDQSYFDPVSRFQAEGPWNGSTSPSEASRHSIRLSGAFRNPQGRISGRASTSAMVLGPSSIDNIPNTITDWSEIAGRFRRLFGMGLSDDVENLPLAILRPAHWLPGFYDSLHQELTRPILDQHGKSIQLWLPFTAENEAAIEFLERYDPANTLGVLGAIRWVAGRACVQPISVLERDKIISLNLDLDIVKPKQTSTQAPPLTETDPETVSIALLDTDETADGIAAAARSPVGRMLIAVQAELENIAESGTAVRRDLGVLSGAANRFETIGLSSCAKPLAHLVSMLTRSSTDPSLRNESAGRLLWSYYLLQLAATQETISVACTGMA